MGEQISADEFTADDYTLFRERLEHQADQLQATVAAPGFGQGAPSVGVEVELALVDARARPVLCNEEVAAAAAASSAGISVELNRFAGEYDTAPVPLAGAPFEALAADLRTGLGALSRAAADHGAQLALVGTLPTLTREDLLAPDVMTPQARYRALAAALGRRKSDDEIRIAGAHDELRTTIPGIVAEGANNALQLHLRVPPQDFARTLDAAHLVAAPVLAVAANSPFFLGHRLWDDTRIPLFTQAVSGAGASQESRRVFLAHGWDRDAPQSFAEDVARFDPLLPVLYEEDPAAVPPSLHELRLHAGSVWRWNRPVYDPTGDGHVRIEFRALPTGPTVVDMVGNAAFMAGAVLALAQDGSARELPFDAVRRNLGRAARNGLSAELEWPTADGRPHRRPVLSVLAELLPRARAALVAHAVAPADADHALAAVGSRLAARTSGALWQSAAAARYEGDSSRHEALVRMTQLMLHHGYDGPPVAEWELPDR